MKQPLPRAFPIRLLHLFPQPPPPLQPGSTSSSLLCSSSSSASAISFRELQDHDFAVNLSLEDEAEQRACGSKWSARTGAAGGEECGEGRGRSSIIVMSGWSESDASAVAGLTLLVASLIFPGLPLLLPLRFLPLFFFCSFTD